MLGVVDILIICLYLSAIIAVGIWSGRKDRNTHDFFVGGRQLPWWAVLGSLVATEVSAATFLAVPGVGFSENFNYLQFGIGSLCARFFVASIFVSVFYNAGCVTIYQYLGQRFGSGSQKIGSVLFLVTRLMASGVRLLIAASGLSIILGIPLSLSIPGFCLLALIYTGAGGIRAVIWTDCVQAFVFILAGICALIFLIEVVGWDSFLQVSQDAGRLDLFRWKPEGSGWTAWFKDANVLWLAMIFGFIQTTAALGTDQDLTQRLLAARSAKQAQRSLILSGFFALPIAALFLMVGAALFSLSQTGQADVLLDLESSDQAFPRFIADLAPAGLKGLLIAGVLAAAMSSLDSAMAALSSSAITDLLEPLRARWKSLGDTLKASRITTLVFAVILGLIATLLHQTGGQYLWLAFQMSSVTYGALLGLFLLGLLTQEKGNDRGNFYAAAVSVVLNILLLVLIRTEVIELGWTWLLIIGTGCTFGIGCLFKKSQHLPNE